jgi:mannitol/fructose-specific phosphotransferase system IIA component (Ntr-type)
MDVMLQTMVIYAGTHGYLDQYPTAKLRGFEAQLCAFLTKRHGAFLDALREAGAFNDELERRANAALDDFVKHFDPNMASDDVDAEYTVKMAMRFGDLGHHAHRELGHLAKSVTARDLFSPSFEEHLADIVKKREEKGDERDRVDHLFAQCPVVDIDEKPAVEALLRRGAQLMSEQIDIPTDTLHEMLMKKEREGTSALTPFLAIPHVTVEGEGKFVLVAARCRHRVAFSDTAPDVHAVFFIACSLDEREFYLEVLAGIARTIQHLEFGKRWLGAKTVDELRDVLVG